MNSKSSYLKSVKMVETSKQVRVDNWGIYFLQRLQLFFSKTDYCDLTLQFEGNVQLKVHRLVMNACTEYFTFLEQTCPALEENTILMPTDLQADVIVPIVNFMYTGMLEFHPSIYDKLYRAAETMNIAVLIKLLTQLQPKNTWPEKKEAINNSAVKKISKPASPLGNDLPSTLQGRKQPWRRASRTQTPTHTRDPIFVMDNTPKPTRFEWPDDDLPPIAPLDSTFDEVSLTSKPLWTKEDDQKAAHSEDDQEHRQSGSKNNSISQEYDEEFPSRDQKGNVQVVEETNNSGDASLKRKSETKLLPSPKKIKITDQDDETVISIKTSNPSELDHTKIVSEILKKFPELMKKKKNIKLKIISAKNEQPQIKVQTTKEKLKVKAIPQIEKPVQPVKKDLKPDNHTVKEAPPQKENAAPVKQAKQKSEFKCVNEDGPWTCVECLGDGEAPEFVLFYLFRKHMTDIHGYKFDNSLCKYCGRKCSNSTLMAYHLFTKHGLIPPLNIKFPKCTHCPFIAVSNEKINEHILIHGKDEAQCQNCKLGFFTKKDLSAHIQITGHNQTVKSLLDCPYCLKKHQSPVGLFTHVRSQHLKEANRDGITSLNERMDIGEVESSPVQEEEQTTKAPPTPLPPVNKPEEKHIPQQKERVKILSNVKVATEESDSSNIVHSIDQAPAPDPTQIAVTTAATALSNIGGSLATNLGLVDIVVLDDNQPYILQQPQGQPGNAEFILPELGANEGILQAATAASNINSTDELVMVLTDHDYQDEQNQGQGDNSNIVVLYSHPVEGQQQQFITSQGNLLVNSQGMLEIRNGAGITTTAGQILVNTSNNTTTTQATPSPIESIEMIRKEIEGSAVSAEPKKQITHEEKEEIVEKIVVNEIIEEVKKSNLNDANEIVSSLDVTDSVPAEPMEVDDIIPEDVEQQHAHILNDNQKAEVNTEVLSKEEDKSIIEPEIADLSDIPPDIPLLESQDEQPGHDIPPETSIGTTDVLKPLTDAKHSLILNDLREYEAMEVDGLACRRKSQENDNAKQSEDITTNHIENLPPQDVTEAVVLQESPLELDTNKDQLLEETLLPPTDASEAIQNASAELPPESETATKYDDTGSIELKAKDEDGDVKQQDDECERENENNENIEVERNGQNESIQSNFEDFTDDSEQSSSQKPHKDLNKEILEDWDDTDSQQSQKSHDRTQEVQDINPEQSQIVNEAAENVNKLMDDWDEEDEEQGKD